MKEHPNFYENLTEACRRLRGTVVTYDGTPMILLAIANHRPDGIFRAYLAPLGSRLNGSFPSSVVGSTESGADGHYLDNWMGANPHSGLIRKMLNSPKFNRFRPFKLGMCNWRTNSQAQAFYCMRQPTRNKEQGLTNRMLLSLPIKVTLDEVQLETAPGGGSRRKSISPTSSPKLDSEAFASCVAGEHPDIDTVLSNLNDNAVVNASAAFHREFAIARGPVGTLFLVYKQNVVGALPNLDRSQLIVDPRYQHTIDAIQELDAFQSITVKS